MGANPDAFLWDFRPYVTPEGFKPSRHWMEVDGAIMQFVAMEKNCDSSANFIKNTVLAGNFTRYVTYMCMYTAIYGNSKCRIRGRIRVRGSKIS